MHSFHFPLTVGAGVCGQRELDRMLSVFFVKNYAGFYSSWSEGKGEETLVYIQQ